MARSSARGLRLLGVANKTTHFSSSIAICGPTHGTAPDNVRPMAGKAQEVGPPANTALLVPQKGNNSIVQPSHWMQTSCQVFSSDCDEAAPSLGVSKQVLSDDHQCTMHNT